MPKYRFRYICLINSPLMLWRCLVCSGSKNLWSLCPKLSCKGVQVHCYEQRINSMVILVFVIQHLHLFNLHPFRTLLEHGLFSLFFTLFLLQTVLFSEWVRRYILWFWVEIILLTAANLRVIFLLPIAVCYYNFK